MGNNGLGLLPYEYVKKGYANDCWIILNRKFIDISQFKP